MRLPPTSTTDVNVGLCAGPSSPTRRYSGAQWASRCVASCRRDLGETGRLASVGVMRAASVRMTNLCAAS